MRSNQPVKIETSGGQKLLEPLLLTGERSYRVDARSAARGERAGEKSEDRQRARSERICKRIGWANREEKTGEYLKNYGIN